MGVVQSSKWKAALPLTTVITVATTVFFSAQTLRTSIEANRVSAQAAVSERYATAVEMLSSDEMTTRIGGIYSLKSIQDESYDRIFAVSSLLSSYIQTFPSNRESTVGDTGLPCPRGSRYPLSVVYNDPVLESGGRTYRPPADLQATAFVLGKQPLSLPTGGSVPAKFDSSCLVGLSFTGGYLRWASFYRANITGADFTGADLQFADFTRVISTLDGSATFSVGSTVFDLADLSNVDFRDMYDSWQLFGWSMNGTILRNARFDNLALVDPIRAEDRAGGPQEGFSDTAERYRSIFAGADLTGASFRGVNFAGANLSQARNLDKADLTGISYTDATTWPDDFEPPPSAP
ncbi:pentapeptide repeat-containing protein [Rhodococcoides kroppenstedtii]|uniref:pentapeptide repeat-containing protein n=1 Tax=Rhodococcoides kroppenstedtii TaxID=293050 RepID=UPI00362ADD27